MIEIAITATGNEVVLKDHHGRVMRLAANVLDLQVVEILAADPYVKQGAVEKLGAGCTSL